MIKIKTRKWFFALLIFWFIVYPFIRMEASAIDPLASRYVERKALFERMESITLVPWYFLAAIDQFERSIHKPNKDKRDHLIAIQIPPSVWAGLLNPDYDDTNPFSISFFDGIGRDADGDGMASIENEYDIIYSLAMWLTEYGTTEEDLRIALWEYYKQEKTVKIIHEVAQMFKKYQTLDLHKKSFPIPKGYRYSYHSSWGDNRGWGGNRIHEGSDIFAGYGTPVRSATYGHVEVMGWNKFGGWRVGIRDINNIYYYYAHLSGFHKDVQAGTIVEPGQIIGYVGSSGYGKPGTSGKFPAHLHFGMYKYNGKTEWAFDPYPHLRLWERKNR